MINKKKNGAKYLGEIRSKKWKIATHILQEKIPVYEEIGEGIAELLAEFQVGAIRLGNSPELVKSSFNEMMTIILSNNDRLVNEKLA
ncbi:MAG: hypothetical protein ACI4HM_04450 [Ruminococcus sp.]